MSFMQSGQKPKVNTNTNQTKKSIITISAAPAQGNSEHLSGFLHWLFRIASEFPLGEYFKLSFQNEVMRQEVPISSLSG